jgi:hypothetical protein
MGTAEASLAIESHAPKHVAIGGNGDFSQHPILSSPLVDGDGHVVFSVGTLSVGYVYLYQAGLSTYRSSSTPWLAHSRGL